MNINIKSVTNDVQMKINLLPQSLEIRNNLGIFTAYLPSYIYTEGYRESTEPMDAVNILPLARFEPTTSTTPPSTTPDIDATNCATETSPIKDVQEALILTTPDAVHVVYWFLFNAWHLFRSQVKA